MSPRYVTNTMAPLRSFVCLLASWKSPCKSPLEFKARCSWGTLFPRKCRVFSHVQQGGYPFLGKVGESTAVCLGAAVNYRPLYRTEIPGLHAESFFIRIGISGLDTFLIGESCVETFWFSIFLYFLHFLSL